MVYNTKNPRRELIHHTSVCMLVCSEKKQNKMEELWLMDDGWGKGSFLSRKGFKVMKLCTFYTSM